VYKIININNFLFFLIFISLSLQALIIIFNNKSYSYFKQNNNSLDKFETIMFNKDGNNLIKADKLIYIDDEHTLLKGQSSLKNNNYEVNSVDILINFNTGNAESSNKTNLVNKTTNVNSEGFKYNNSSSIINFIGDTVVFFK
tara:strand:+ start:1740 stop:2165 length:426 start_codon:yes stop_codon:yes gene_type:complete